MTSPNSNNKVFDEEWWRLRSQRLTEEPNPKDNRQLFPENYMFLDSSSPAAEAREDYRRSVLCVNFRALKDKTQVYPLEQEHHVRTRLSHSLEVATIGSYIFSDIMERDLEKNCVRNLEQQETSNRHRIFECLENSESSADALRDSLASACLLHDTGNPPFGHSGEDSIRSWFANNDLSEFISQEESEEWKRYVADLETFEGNANSLRIALSPSSLFDGQRLNLTATTVAAMVKYPWKSDSSYARKKKKFNYFESDFDRLTQLNEDAGRILGEGANQRHPLSFIMEAADDISYVTSDFEDAFRVGSFEISEILRYALDPNLKTDNGFTWDSAKLHTFTLFALLALLAGSEEDHDFLIQQMVLFRERRKKTIAHSQDIISKDTFNNWSPNNPIAFVDGAIDYLLSSEGKGLNHTYSVALKDYPSLNAQDRRRLQETYVSRWVDLVRKWLVFSVSKGFAQNPDTFSLSECGNDSILYGAKEHYGTLLLQKSIMKHFVYSSSREIKLNTRAKSTLWGLLDIFIPATLKSETIVVDTETSTQPEDVVHLIPLHLRLDYLERKAEYEKRNGEAWGHARDQYERCMLVLDYISSMTDGFALSLHEELRG